HKLLRQGLRRAVEEAGFDVVGEAGDGEEAVRLAIELQPDLVLMDVTMPVLDGIEATRRLRQSAPEALVLFSAWRRLKRLDDLGIGRRGERLHRSIDSISGRPGRQLSRMMPIRTAVSTAWVRSRASSFS
ncbi:MAG TPA: response regulator transcription factor, partial [Acidimicrobiia bacterium]|nr:response regulator transcription factor [Acidimicrobiia bacterium]